MCLFTAISAQESHSSRDYRLAGLKRPASHNYVSLKKLKIMENLQLIRKRFDDARKLYGYADKIATPSGLKVKGRYLLAESGAVTPSHDPFDSFCKS